MLILKQVVSEDCLLGAPDERGDDLEGREPEAGLAGEPCSEGLHARVADVEALPRELLFPGSAVRTVARDVVVESKDAVEHRRRHARRLPRHEQLPPLPHRRHIGRLLSLSKPRRGGEELGGAGAVAERVGRAHPERDAAAREPGGLDRERRGTATHDVVVVPRWREAVEQSGGRRVGVDVGHGELGRREDEGDLGGVGVDDDDVAVADDAAGEGGEEGERGGERALEDGEGVDGWRGRWEEAEGAEGDVEHVAVGVEAGEREGRVLWWGGWREVHGVENLELHGDGVIRRRPSCCVVTRQCRERDRLLTVRCCVDEGTTTMTSCPPGLKAVNGNDMAELGEAARGLVDRVLLLVCLVDTRV